MTLAAGIAAFVASPARRQHLALEAGAELFRARLLTLLPARIFTRQLGAQRPLPEGSETPAPELAFEIGRMVERVAGALPFRAVCLQQAMAAARMLRRRGLSPAVCLGMRRVEAGAAPRYDAHAWVEVGRQVVNGAAGCSGCVVLARFV